MASINDVTTVIASALTEISMSGTLDVDMDGGEQVEVIGRPTGEDVEVVVTVRPISDRELEPMADSQ